MSVAVRELQEAAGKELGALQEFLSKNTFPIVEGRKVTFVFHGAADEVHLRHWIFGLPSS